MGGTPRSRGDRRMAGACLICPYMAGASCARLPETFNAAYYAAFS